MKRFAVYSSLVGSYDKIRQPLVVDERFDYIMFTDNKVVDKVGDWQIRQIPNIKGSNRLISRYVKCHPTKVLDGYEASLYLDANIQIITKEVYERFIELVENGTEWGGIQHPSQACVYEEICAIVDLKWVHDYDVVNWYGTMKKDGFPEGWGLFENNVIFRRHTQKVEAIGDLWWQTLTSGCERDQFSLMYILWKSQPTTALFLPVGECPRLNSRNFAYYEHNPHKRVLHLGIWERLRRSCLRFSSTGLRAGYHDLFDSLSRFQKPKFRLYVWGVFATFKNGRRLLRNR